MDYKELILFTIAVFGCVFGVYQWVKKSTKEDAIETKEVAAQSALIMNELKHISSNVDVIKTDVKVLNAERSKDREDILILGERHEALSDKLNTAFIKIDEVRENSVSKIDFDSLKQDVEGLKH